MTIDITNYKPRAAIRLEVPKVGSTTETVTITPSIISAKWTTNNHLQADELTVTMGWEESGCDPRLLKNATCEFYMWDDNSQEWDDGLSQKFLRFTGICTKSSRKLSGDSSDVTMTFQDYTTLFLNMKPYPTTGLPEYNETIPEIWDKICDNVGTRDPSNGKIISNVADLRGLADDPDEDVRGDVAAIRGNSPSSARRGGLDISRLDEVYHTKTLGSIVNERFRAIAKPSPPTQANAWDVWQWCVASLGLVSYIEKDRCVVMTTTEHYADTGAPVLMYGENILEFEENSDAKISGKGVMLKSFDHATGRTIEAVYPLPGDERLKLKKSVAKRAFKEGREVNVNEVSGDYQEFQYFEIQDQEALDIRAKEAYEEFSRQQMDGTLKTHEMILEGVDGEPFDILSLKANDTIVVAIDPDIREFANNAEGAARYMIDVLGYNEGLAYIIAQSLDATEIRRTTKFHVTSMDVDYKDGECSIEIKYHNLIVSKEESDVAAIRGQL